jgi:NAD(P)-dependent dehydrogenase (short-subunit alcohol dehydrogenase family)
MINYQPSVLVTGASTGIGLAITQYLASKGMHVFAGARKQEVLEDLAKVSNVTPLKLDVTDAEDIKQAKKIIEEKTEGLFGLVNNAGVGNGGPLMDVSVEDLRSHFEVNLFGVHQITQAVFPLLLKAKGRIVMMSSDSGFFATPFFGPYCSSKFALEGYSDSLRREITPYGVKVIIIEPGRVTTPIWDKGEKYLNKYAGSLFAAEARAIGEYAIRKGKTTGLAPIEVAKTVYQVLTAASPKLRYIVAENKLEYQLMKILPASYVDKLALKKVQKVVGLARSAANHSK